MKLPFFKNSGGTVQFFTSAVNSLTSHVHMIIKRKHHGLCTCLLIIIIDCALAHYGTSFNNANNQ